MQRAASQFLACLPCLKTLALILARRRAHPCLHARMSCTNGWATHARTSPELRLGGRCTIDYTNGGTVRCCTSHGGRTPYTRLDLRCGDLEMDVAALPVSTRTLSWRQVSMARSIEASSELSCAPQAMVALHLSLLAVDSKLLWSH
jgi:hypothetical protein